MTKRYIQDPVTLKLVPAEEYRRPEGLHHIQGDLEPFRSHVDGALIASRRDLREHNRRNNVVEGGEVLQDHERAKKKREDFYAGRPYDTERRVDAVKFATELHERGRSKADIRQMVENYQKRN